ncbi:MAG: hypothetical protein H6970_10920 [Gammaproteobacteria bacterium]|nr:hypothetical protein [Gammaproteobacteria bacterium]
MPKLQRSIILLLSCLLLVVTWATASARELPIVTGEHWTTATEREKKAFLLGMETIIKVEQELQGSNPGPEIRERSFIPDLVKGLSQYTITTAMQAIDAYYAKNPDKVKRPVLEVIWFELTLPNLASR